MCTCEFFARWLIRIWVSYYTKKLVKFPTNPNLSSPSGIAGLFIIKLLQWGGRGALKSRGSSASRRLLHEKDIVLSQPCYCLEKSIPIWVMYDNELKSIKIMWSRYDCAVNLATFLALHFKVIIGEYRILIRPNKSLRLFPWEVSTLKPMRKLPLLSRS